MRLQEAIRIYMVCIAAEGRELRIAREYRYIPEMFVAIVGDMDLAALSPAHFRQHMAVVPVSGLSEIRNHSAVLHFFWDWVKAQKMLHPVRQPETRFKRGSRWSLLPRQVAVRLKLPLAL